MTDQTIGPRTGPSSYDFPLLDVSVHRDGTSAWVVDVQGELDLATGELLRRHLDSYFRLGENGGQPSRIIYVLSELSFIDASGLHALLGAADGYGIDTVTIRQPSPAVRRLLELVHLESMIEAPSRR